MKYPLISVIIPIYNVEKYLEKCISSVCAQSYNNLQIILVDDGSTDHSADICNKFKAMDSRVIFIQKVNGGLVSARKAGIKAAIGEYISFIDGDDWIDEDTFGQIAEYLLIPGQVDMIVYGCIEEYSKFKVYKKNTVENGIYKGKKLEQLKRNILMDDTFFEWKILPHLCDKVIKKTLLTENINNISNAISFGEDVVFTRLCMMRAESVYVRDITPYHYRQREGSIVKGRKELNLNNFQDIYVTLIKEFRGNDDLELQLKFYMFFILCLKAYSNIGSRMTLFPFIKVQQDCRVMVYGAGGFGKVVVDYIKRSNDLALAGWTDKKADYYKKQGMKVSSLEEVYTVNYDYLVIAILNENIASEIKKELMRKGISEEKIDYVRREVLEKQELPDWLYDIG